jgi:predicted nuclease of predicted toxin-antitoxin system
MKFIVDAQLPRELSHFLNHQGHDSKHTLDLPDKNKTSDSEIIRIADEEKRIVISKDNDFLESFLIKTEPRKLILVRTGNVSNKNLIQLFKNHYNILIQMINRSSLVEITRSDIAEHE